MYGKLNYARAREKGKGKGLSWSLALSLPLLWCHKCEWERELWIFTSVQLTNPMSIKGYQAAAAAGREREWVAERRKNTLCAVDFCVIFIAFKLAGSACWFYCDQAGHSRFIRDRERTVKYDILWCLFNAIQDDLNCRHTTSRIICSNNLPLVCTSIWFASSRFAPPRPIAT